MAGGTGPVVVGVDGSPGSVTALRWALTEADASGRELVAVTVRQRRSGGDRPRGWALAEAGDPASTPVLGSHGDGRMLRFLEPAG